MPDSVQDAGSSAMTSINKSGDTAAEPDRSARQRQRHTLSLTDSAAVSAAADQ
jgi:hypothetical protein